MYIIYNIYIYLYIILSVIYVIESLLGLGGRGVTLRKHAKTDHKNGYSPDLEDEHGLYRWGQGKDHKHIHQDPLLNTRIRRKGRRGEAEGEEWKIWVSL